MSDLYQKLANVYHLLFPARAPQLKLLISLAGDPTARILDVASGTGEYVAALSNLGYAASGIELDGAMHAQALLRHPELVGHAPPRLIQGDMQDAERLTTGTWQLAFCIGNSLPHLARDADIASVIAALIALTRPAGKVLLQVANFDRVLKNAYEASFESTYSLCDETHGLAFDLPMLSATVDEGTPVAFARQYLLRRAEDLTDSIETPKSLAFCTKLTIGSKVHQAATPLQLLTRERLEYCIPRGVDQQWLGDFTGAKWSSDSPATIVILG